MLEVIKHSHVEGIVRSTEMGSMLGLLADRMQAYDWVSRSVDLSRTEKQDFDQKLGDLDPPTNPREYPDDIAYAALGSLLTAKRLETVKKALHSIDLLGELMSVDGYYGKRATVRSLDPERYSIATARMNKYGDLDGLGKWYEKRSGKITEVNLHPTHGGWIALQGSRGRIHSAGPLIARSGNTYVPAFEITLD